MASNQGILASPGAFQNITAYLPPALQTYLDGAIGQLSEVLAGSNEFLEARGLPPTLLYSTLACAALAAVPYGMSRYSPWIRGGVSPYASQTDSQGIPQVTDEDYSYITSEDLELATPRSYGHDNRSPSSPIDDEEDDVLIVTHKGDLYPIVFPAYSIGDGKVFVQDVRDRVALIMKVSDRRKRRIKMVYKGRHLKGQDKPIRDYGVKNNSEILLIIPDGKASDEDDEDGEFSGSGSGEDIVVPDARDERKPRKSKSTKKGGKKKKPKKDQGAGTHLNVPDRDAREGGGSGRSPSVDRSRHPSRVPSPAVPAGPLERLNAVSDHFETQLLPLCRDFMAKPPADPKKCEDEHRKLSETILQHVLLKLDEVDTGGDQDVRARRKELVNRVQDFLKLLDEKLPEGVVPAERF